MTTIAFIGLGNMGGPMAANLIKAGHKVVAFDLVEGGALCRGCRRGPALSPGALGLMRRVLGGDLAGALAEPVDTAVLLFEGDSPAAAEAFAKADPYVLAGLVARWRVREWMTVVGEGAAKPVR